MLSDLPNIKYLNSGNFFLIAGPCVIENEQIPIEIARVLKSLSDLHKVPLIFKASYKKANRTKLNSFTGIGNEKALKLMKRISNEFQVPTLTDIHTEAEAYIAAKYVDILQIPAFLCRQTDLLIAAAKTGKFVNIKKGQFVSPQAMKFAVDKVRQNGNNHVMLTERGSFFGYNDLVVDIRSIPEMQKNHVPVVLDITHSLQQPNQESGVTGGKPELIGTLGCAGVAAGADGLFLETHPNPKIAKSDGENMLPLDQLEHLLLKWIAIKQALNASS